MGTILELKDLEPWMVVYFATLAFIWGLVFGSFLNCAAWRIAHGMSFLKGRSICPACKHELGARDLVPLFSYIFRKGRCRYCGEKISIRYPLTELLFGLVTVDLFLNTGISLLFIRDFVFLCCLFCLSLVDLDIMEIPDGALITAIVAWVCYLPFCTLNTWFFVDHLGAAFLYSAVLLILSLVMDKVLKKESMGGGDIKLIFVAGLYLGLVGSLFMILIAAVTGLIVSLKRGRIPFGPYISIACYLMITAGQGLVDFYMSLF